MAAVEALAQPLDQLSEAFFQGHEERRFARAGRVRCPLAPLFPCLQCGAGEAAVLLFHLLEPRQDGANTQTSCVAAENSGEQRVGDVLEHGIPEMPAHKSRHTFIVVLGTLLQTAEPGPREPFSRESRLACQREQRRRGHGPEASWDEQHQPVGKRHEPSLVQNVGAAVPVIRADQ